MRDLRAFFSALLYELNKALFGLILAFFAQGIFIGYQAYVTGELTPLWVTLFSGCVVCVCAWRIFQTTKRSGKLRALVDDLSNSYEEKSESKGK